MYLFSKEIKYFKNIMHNDRLINKLNKYKDLQFM